MRPQEVLSKKEVLKMIREESNVSNKAFISTLYESGCRIGELLPLRLKNIEFDECGAQYLWLMVKREYAE